MNFFKSISKKTIFQKVIQISNIPIRQIVKKQIADLRRQKTQNDKKESSQKVQIKQLDNDYSEPNIQQAQQFIISLISTTKQFKKSQKQKLRKKQIYNGLEIQPIYLQQYNFKNLFSMQIQIVQHQGFQRTQVLHNYLNQINVAIKNVLFLSNISLFQVFQFVDIYVIKTTELLAKIKILRNSLLINQLHILNSIKRKYKSKQVIQQKLQLLRKIKQKDQIATIRPQNLQQVYYSQRARHKLYLKIKNIKIKASYFINLSNQIVKISKNNIKIIRQNFQQWLNKGNQDFSQKKVQKLFICLYFIKKQAIYIDNHIKLDFNSLDLNILTSKIEEIKLWKNYRYIRDPSMKDQILQFLDKTIDQIKNILIQ